MFRTASGDDDEDGDMLSGMALDGGFCLWYSSDLGPERSQLDSFTREPIDSSLLNTRLPLLQLMPSVVSTRSDLCPSWLALKLLRAFGLYLFGIPGMDTDLRFGILREIALPLSSMAWTCCWRLLDFRT